MTSKLLIADDHSLVRAGICSLLAIRPDIEIIGEAESGLQAMSMIRKLNPDMVLMDIAMPDMNGIEAINEAFRENRDIIFIVLSMYSDKKMVAKALKAGARGYVIKSCDSSELNDAIDYVKAGKIYLNRNMSQSLIKAYIERLGDPSDENILTHKERIVLQMIAEGRTTKDIASLLNISVKTVEAHRSNIMNKLDLRHMADLTKYAIREGLTQLN